MLAPCRREAMLPDICAEAWLRHQKRQHGCRTPKLKTLGYARLTQPTRLQGEDTLRHTTCNLG